MQVEKKKGGGYVNRGEFDSHWWEERVRRWRV
jgi:hypothetical protein